MLSDSLFCIYLYVYVALKAFRDNQTNLNEYTFGYDILLLMQKVAKNCFNVNFQSFFLSIL